MLWRRALKICPDPPLRYGFRCGGHGLTCWGKDIHEARRQLEGLEFLRMRA